MNATPNITTSSSPFAQCIILFDAAKLHAIWQRDTALYFPRWSPRHAFKVLRFAWFYLRARRNGTPIVAPTVALGFSPETGALIARFIDGRHRFRYFLDTGSKNVAVATTLSGLRIAARFGLIAREEHDHVTTTQAA